MKHIEKDKIYLFARRWENRFRTGTLVELEFETAFGEECIGLGFQMDSGQAFERLYPGCFPISSGKIDEVIGSVNDADLLGSAVFSQWRYLTHWSGGYVLDEKTRHWFAAVLGRMKELTRKKA